MEGLGEDRFASLPGRGHTRVTIASSVNAPR
jgi:hypothetical protein